MRTGGSVHDGVHFYPRIELDHKTPSQVDPKRCNGKHCALLSCSRAIEDISHIDEGGCYRLLAAIIRAAATHTPAAMQQLHARQSSECCALDCVLCLRVFRIEFGQVDSSSAIVALLLPDGRALSSHQLSHWHATSDHRGA